MDPGTAIGAVSLLFQVFSGCLRVYQLFSEAKGFEKDYDFIRVRFKTEQYRLLDFASVAGLDTQDDALLIKSSNRDLLIQVLDRQLRMMMRFGRLDERLNRLAHPLVVHEMTDPGTSENDNSLTDRFPQNNPILQKALTVAKCFFKFPTRLHWLFFDKTKVEELLAKLVGSNDFLQELLTARQLEELKIQELQTSYQIMQLNNKVDQIQEIVQGAVLPLIITHLEMGRELSIGQHKFPDSSATTVSALIPSLAQLGQFKALASSIDQAKSCKFKEDVYDSTVLEISRASLVLDEEDDEKKASLRAYGWYYGAEQRRQRIWIEWKRMDARHAHNPADGPDPSTLRRFQALVALLKEYPQTRNFRAPPCLGYYLHTYSETGTRYGLLFRHPAGIDPHTYPKSLRELLGSIHNDGTRLPSLTRRVQLMQTLVQSIEKLHAVNWLHKDLCSHNVIFFPSPGEPFNPVELYLTGFGYSRPGNASSMSSSARSTVEEDLYKHPGVQGSPGEDSHGMGFNKYHDIYSMAVVLVEIALWRPIEAVLELEEKSKIKVRDVVKARENLLGEHMCHIKAAIGDSAAAAVEACLIGPSAFQLPAPGKEDDSQTAAQQQMMFYNIVVKPLTDMRL